jgi:hypothetical protein
MGSILVEMALLQHRATSTSTQGALDYLEEACVMYNDLEGKHVRYALTLSNIARAYRSVTRGGWGSRKRV